MAQSAKTENEELRKLQLLKTQNDRTINALQDDVKRTRQQLDGLRRESLKMKNENNEFQVIYFLRQITIFIFLAPVTDYFTKN